MTNRQLDEEAIFHIARDLTDEGKRAVNLDQVCNGDLALRERVDRLLLVHEQEQSFLKSDRSIPSTALGGRLSAAPGQYIGRYKLPQKIGEGGFGVVHMA